MFQRDKLLYSKLTKHVGLIASVCLCVGVFLRAKGSVCICECIHVIRSALPSAPHAPLPPLGRTACLAASPPACHSPLTTPTNGRPLQQSHMRAASYQKILHYTHAMYTCVQAACTVHSPTYTGYPPALLILVQCT